MRLGVLTLGGAHRLVADTGELLDLQRPGDVGDLVRDGADPRRLTGAALPPDTDARALSAPLRPGKIAAIALNYRDHFRATGVEPPTRPLVAAKFPTAVIGPDAPIVIDGELTGRVDWEVELAVVIGRLMRKVREDQALDHVFGYTVANDLCARDVQGADGQWTRAKSFDTFCPLGPVIVTADEIPDPQVLALRTRVNGETVQDSSTAEMLFSVAELLAFCSRNFTLEPGDVVLTGTPWGCGEFMKPRRSLHDRDSVEVEVEGIGVLRNPVVEIAGP